ncbi:hypothetical protein OTK49_01080 [Vibrio coralliirubri]|uniref:hypothetical protein n=1 Tax=Vibrio coralliirubri TaxID=1516159 RepID=UPI002283ABFE|nr:hypothetical protein [Vibrio coralliirubri]MCY9861122.1 hypothetical protein [Vibrio coralliirubri]
MPQDEKFHRLPFSTQWQHSHMNYIKSNTIQALHFFGSTKALLFLFLPMYIFSLAFVTSATLNQNLANLKAENSLIAEYTNELIDCRDHCIKTSEEQDFIADDVKERIEKLNGKYELNTLLTLDAKQVTEDHEDRLLQRIAEIDLGYDSLAKTDDSEKIWADTKLALYTEMGEIEQNFIEIERLINFLSKPWTIMIWLLFAAASLFHKRKSK